MSRGLWDYKDQNLQQEIFGWPTTKDLREELLLIFGVDERTTN